MSELQNAYSLVLGINNYQLINNLTQSVSDAEDIVKILTDPKFGGYSESHVRKLLDEKATKKAFLDALDWLAKNADEASTVLIYFSGYGAQTYSGESEGYLLMHDADPWSEDAPAQVDISKLRETAVTSSELASALDEIPASKIAVFLDACHSNGLTNPRTPFFNAALLRQGLPESFYEDLSSGSGRVLISSSRPNQASWKSKELKNSVFAHALLNGLQGGASKSDGIHILDLFYYIEIQVPLLIQQFSLVDPLTEKLVEQVPYVKGDAASNYPVAHLPKHEAETVKEGVEQKGDTERREMHSFLTFLYKEIRIAYDLDELKSLCFQLKVPFDDLDASTLKGKARELVLYMFRRGQEDKLLAQLKEDRPDPDKEWLEVPRGQERITPSSLDTENSGRHSDDLPIPFRNQKNALYAIEQQLIADEPFMYVSAPPQMGKTYLLNEIQHRCEQDDILPANPINGQHGPQKWGVVKIDLTTLEQEISDGSHLMALFCEGLGFEASKTVRGLAQAIRKLENEDIRVLFLLNGTEYLSEELAEYLHETLGQLTLLLNDTPVFNPAFVAAGRKVFSAWESSYSPKMKPIELVPFKRPSINQLLHEVRNHKSVRETWYEKQAYLIHQCTAGHPGCIARLITYLLDKQWTIRNPNSDEVFLEAIVPVVEETILTYHNVDGNRALEAADYQKLSRLLLELSTFRIITKELIESSAAKLGLDTTPEELLRIEEQIGHSLLVKWDKHRGWYEIPYSVRHLLSRWETVVNDNKLERNCVAFRIYHQWLDRSEPRPARLPASGEVQMSYIREAIYHKALCSELECENASDLEDAFSALQYRLQGYSQHLRVHPSQPPFRMLQERMRDDDELRETVERIFGDHAYTELVASIDDINMEP